MNNANIVSNYNHNSDIYWIQSQVNITKILRQIFINNLLYTCFLHITHITTFNML